MIKKKLIYLLLFISFVLFVKPAYADVYIPSRIEAFLLDQNYFLSTIIIVSIVNMLFETIILYFLGLKTKKMVLSVGAANLISWPIFAFLTEKYPLFNVIVVLELVVIVFESLFIYLLNKELKIAKLFLKVLLANFLSATIGSYFLSRIVYLLLREILHLFNLFNW